MPGPTRFTIEDRSYIDPGGIVTVPKAPTTPPPNNIAEIEISSEDAKRIKTMKDYFDYIEKVAITVQHNAVR